MSYAVWWCWLDCVQDSLYAFMAGLPDPEHWMMEKAFDAEHRRLFPEFYAL